MADENEQADAGGEWSAIKQILLAERAQLTRHRDVLARKDRHMSAKANDAIVLIDAALARIADGTYGTCERCGKTISPDRLEAIPHAALCIACQAGGRRNR